MRPMLLAPEAHAPTTAAWILPPAITAQLQKRMMAHATTPVAQAPDAAGNGMHWDAATQSCIITPPSVAPDAECTLLNLQELAEGYQILMAQNAVQDSLILALQDSLSNCSNFTEDGSTSVEGPCVGQDHVTFYRLRLQRRGNRRPMLVRRKSADRILFGREHS